MYPDSEILFPVRCIPELRSLRPGATWQHLIDHLCKLPETHEDVLAFSLMMIRLSNCLTCDLDSYRASLGCCQCARRTIQGFKGTDAALVNKMEEARAELRASYASRVPGGNGNGGSNGNGSGNGHLPPPSAPERRTRRGAPRSRARAKA